MSRMPESVMKAFGIKWAIDINFVTPKKVMIRFNENGYDKDDVRENVVALTVVDGSNYGFVSIDITYKGENGGEGKISTSIQNLKEILILD